MRISAETNFLSRRFGDEAAVRMIAEAGFDCVDYTMTLMCEEGHILNSDAAFEHLNHLKKLGQELGIVYGQAHAPFRFDLSCVSSGLEQAMQSVVRCFEYAAVLEIPIVVVHPLQHLPYRTNQKAVWDLNMAYYRDLIPYARHFGIKIALENLFDRDGRDILVAGVCADPRRYVEAIDRLDSPQIVACVDIGHGVLIGEDPGELIRALGHDRVKALHVNDNNQISDEHTIPYLGKGDWEEAARALADIRYDGDFTFEAFAFHNRFPDPMKQAALRFTAELGRYLTGRIETYRKEAQ